MKKFNIIHICFTILFLCLWGYLDIYVKLQSFYWLVCELTCLLLIFSGAYFIKIKQKKKGIWGIVFFICWSFFLLGNTGYQEITRYNRNICQDKFGKEFNKRRRSLGVPEIPPDWSIKSRDRFSVDWKGKDGIIGHESKYIAIESCTADYEEDSYNLKPIDSIKRYMSIHTKYTRGRGKDSIFFYYQIGDSTRTISRKQADSVFDAEKIKKDY